MTPSGSLANGQTVHVRLDPDENQGPPGDIWFPGVATVRAYQCDPENIDCTDPVTLGTVSSHWEGDVTIVRNLPDGYVCKKPASCNLIVSYQFAAPEQLLGTYTFNVSSK